ncbi:WxL domain-containing protein [Lapidilactobacillus gannanensis]|uniref:WxL domain-containing protein n=1 Tax=Lapidilactobacillus gannanensis TaxID=2486002 RepID=A0ABW4BLR4_9LACO|nr:WxL domain-containing protein [Lapidilactobacillus gannanensis]
MKLNKTMALLAVLALSTFSTGITATQAATGDTTNEVADGTKANINLTTDPTDPDNPRDTGSIILKSAPTIEFGTQVLTGATKTYDADTNPTDPIKVINPGFTSGWTVTVAASDFKNADGSKTLNGAQLTLDAGTVANADPVDTKTDGVSSTGLKLNSSAAPVFDATAGNGIGTFTSTYTKTQAHLTVPSTATADSYASTLTWTIANTPK